MCVCVRGCGCVAVWVDTQAATQAELATCAEHLQTRTHELTACQAELSDTQAQLSANAASGKLHSQHLQDEITQRAAEAEAERARLVARIARLEGKLKRQEALATGQLDDIAALDVRANTASEKLAAETEAHASVRGCGCGCACVAVAVAVPVPVAMAVWLWLQLWLRVAVAACVHMWFATIAAALTHCVACWWCRPRSCFVKPASRCLAS